MQHYYLLLLLMNFKQLEQYFIAHLAFLYEADEANEMYDMVVGAFTGWGRAQLLMNGSQEVQATEHDHYLSILEELKKGRPVQHIFEEAWFYGLKFKVTDAVLIPRPETEELVQWILQSIAPKAEGDLRLLDIGTGSGCIAITLKVKAPLLQVDALDVSAAALAIARENALSNQGPVNFIHADILSYRTALKYNLIVSNPPYIKEDEREAMHQNVLLYEPHLALFVSNENPLVFYRRIADFALSNLAEDGLLFFEINEYLGKETVEMLKDKGFINIVLKQDMQMKDRMICCQHPAKS